MTKQQITVREARSEADARKFWAELYTHFKRDIIPDPNHEDREYFLGSEYRETIEKLHTRETDPMHWLFFSRGGEDIGLAMPVIFTSEDGKGFIMEFCVFPEYRGGTGTDCAHALFDWARERGAEYFELNHGGDERRQRFWSRLGFVANGYDEWGEPLMLLPPEREVSFTVDILTDAGCQLFHLQNSYLAEIGEDMLSEEKQEHLKRAVEEGRITFFAAHRGYRCVGMCSVAAHFSTFACGDVGVFEDFYIEPAFRKKGIARKLAEAAQNWCLSQGLLSLSVCCTPCDEAMYQALGFETKLGSIHAKI